ncbi:ABC transporter ATP-binding protein [Pelagicoccus mobilis]|uniref:ABC transporter ATP-binding protein n=1 Tax=Pelagicoccus mobilis TaxID=415221 RepID=A0A934RZB2_9BACT|nr:ABC transporter ATP-binding protein [Pelagicoccus mobilis]MBK1879497.1 ABC transporter ATP-binding protein [Pelagicoccus mobilis]
MPNAIELKNVTKTYKLWKNPSAKSQFALFDLIVSTLPLNVGQSLLKKMQGKFYSDFHAVKDLNLTIETGSSHGIIGKNGAGKSTLLEIIAGTVPPTSGTVTVKGKLAALLELGSGFNPEFTGRDNVFLYASILGLSKKKTYELFPEIEAFAEIGKFIDQPLKTYSSGMKMRLAFSVISFLEPEILIIDEALAVGDDTFKRKCYSRLDYLLKKGITFLLVSHSSANIVQLCDNAHWIHGGELLLSGPSKEVTNRYQQFTSRSTQPSVEKIRAELSRSDTQKKSKEEGPKKEEEDFYSSDFLPESRISYHPEGGYIENVALSDLSNKRLTHITARKRYKVTFDVTFTQSHTNVFFSYLVKTLQGTQLGGALSHHRTKAIECVDSGQTYLVKFEFDANLAHSTYFLNVGVKAIGGEKEYFVHRIIDAVTFRVHPIKDATVSSFVDFNTTSSIQKR